MERRAFHDLFLVVVVFVTTFVAVKGFYTKTCDHQSLASNVKSAAICINKVQLASVEDIVESAEGEAEQNKSLNLKSLMKIAQTSRSGLAKCMDVFFRAWFQTDITGFIVQVVSEIMFPMPRPKWNVMGASWRFIDFHFDKECPFDELTRVMYTEGIDCPLTVLGWKGLGVAGVGSKWPPSFLDPRNSTTWCNILLNRGINSCINANRCFSKQEMNLMCDLTATFHTMAMEDLIILNKKFGNFSSAWSALLIAIDPESGLGLSPEAYQRMEEDYINYFQIGSACKTTLMEYSMISNSPRVQPLLTMIYFTVFIIYLSKSSVVSFAHL